MCECTGHKSLIVQFLIFETVGCISVIIKHTIYNRNFFFNVYLVLTIFYYEYTSIFYKHIHS